MKKKVTAKKIDLIIKDLFTIKYIGFHRFNHKMRPLLILKFKIS